MFLNLILSGLFFVIGLTIINTIRFLNHKKVKFRFSFSYSHYHLFIVTLLFGTLAEYLLVENDMRLLFFFFSGIWGMFGETFFSITWFLLFKRRFWDYQVATLFNKFTSLLNYIPWGIGGLMYFDVAKLVNIEDRMIKSRDLLEYMVLSNLILLLILSARLILKLLVNKDFRFKQFTYLNYCFFVSGFLIPMVYLAAKDVRYLYFSFAAGVTAWTLEYLFGKVCQLFLGRKLWLYNYETFDHGHVTLLSIIPFSMGGYFFMLGYWLLAKLF